MRKLLIMLMIVALASFLFVGCDIVTPEPVDPDKPDVICPVVEVSSEVEIGGKNYIKGGKQEITVTFTVPTELASVYVGASLRSKLGELLTGEVIMYPNDDKTIYTGDFVFGTLEANKCGEAYIYVETCETCDYCKYPYTVDTVGPYASIKITEVTGICPGESYLKFDSAWTGDNNGGCPPYAGGCCGDTCSELASWTIDVYDGTILPDDPLFDCCAKPLYSGEGIACPILWVTDCIEYGKTEDNTFFAIIELKDAVGNSTKYYAGFMFITGDGIMVFEWTLNGAWYSEIAEDGIVGADCP